MPGMTWTAPKVNRRDEPGIADEREMLESWLDYHRETLLLKCAGLTAEQLRERAVAPSSLSLLGLVRHLADVERSWFRRRLDQQDIPYRFIREDNENSDFDDVDTADPGEAFTAFASEVEACRAVAATHGLDDTFVDQRGVRLSLRWVYVHLIEEYARHNGHADLLRERLDGSVGD
ncbi:hypothetical protein FraEuI1c_1192 [Pseudofrankia inefficax]|uniref:Mini-circle protein n=2 Tax=Pseudofrankia inefficax (strain DSM 45817 / CECT 9037 / DDB 130130 / EuI1c) TaxID=298654 RepID=E3J186_PSEI1|nr:hypothetical protein FraEuI1c_1192 [Pseudofrankia inefficax]